MTPWSLYHEKKNLIEAIYLKMWILNQPLRFDVQSCYAFVSDFSGQISVLKISNNGFEVITTLKGHSGMFILYS